MREEQIARLHMWLGILQTIRALLILCSVGAIILALTGNGVALVIEVFLLTVLISIPIALIRRKHDRLEAANSTLAASR